MRVVATRMATMMIMIMGANKGGDDGLANAHGDMHPLHRYHIDDHSGST